MIDATKAASEASANRQGDARPNSLLYVKISSSSIGFLHFDIQARPGVFPVLHAFMAGQLYASVGVSTV